MNREQQQFTITLTGAQVNAAFAAICQYSHKQRLASRLDKLRATAPRAYEDAMQELTHVLDVQCKLGDALIEVNA